MSGEAMWSKHGKRACLEETSPSKRMRRRIEDMFLSNAMSGMEADGLIRDGIDAKVFKGRHRGIPGHNSHRDVLARLLKNTHWPELYWAKVRSCHPKRQRPVVCLLPFLLPHEILGAIAKKSSADSGWCKGGLSTAAASHLEHVSGQLSASDLLALGLWLDGTPCNWDRTKSIETVAMSFPGQTDESAGIRMALTCIMKHHCLKHRTMDDVLAVIAWSMECALNGTYPSCRHDGTPWLKSDKQRAKWAAKPIRVRAAVAEVRGDWACLKQTFRFPGWNENNGCCFRCNVKPQDIRQFDISAPWRKPENRHSFWSLILKIAALGTGICPIFSIPFLGSNQFAIDWLHCVDLGVTQDYLGNLFWAALPKLPGTNREQKISCLFLKIQEFYKRTNCSSRLDDLKETMLRKTAASKPKLRAKAAEARFLVPFAKELANELFTGDGAFEQTLRETAALLNSCYDMLSTSKYSSEVLASSRKRFCVLYGALESASPFPYWRVKPKFHLFQELCEFDSVCPSTCWTYRDEDFGGSVAAAARSRGGFANQASAAYKVLTKFRARHNVPVLK